MLHPCKLQGQDNGQQYMQLTADSTNMPCISRVWSSPIFQRQTCILDCTGIAISNAWTADSTHVITKEAVSLSSVIVIWGLLCGLPLVTEGW